VALYFILLHHDMMLWGNIMCALRQLL